MSALKVYDTNVSVDYGTPIPIVTPDQTTPQYATLTKSWNGAWRGDMLDGSGWELGRRVFSFAHLESRLHVVRKPTEFPEPCLARVF